MRYIKIETCKDCPNLDHRGGFGKVLYVPWCKQTGLDLPYTVEIHQRSAFVGGAPRMYASTNFEIPESCPLPKDVL